MIHPNRETTGTLNFPSKKNQIKKLINLPHYIEYFLKRRFAYFGFRLCWAFVAVQAFSSCGERALLFTVVHELLIEVVLLLQSTGSVVAVWA